MSDLAGLTLSWLLTYLVHSTLLLATVFLIERSGRIRSAALLATLWRSALFGALATASLQVVFATAPLHARLPASPRQPVAIMPSPHRPAISMDLDQPRAATRSAQGPATGPKQAPAKQAMAPAASDDARPAALRTVAAWSRAHWTFLALGVWAALVLVLLARLGLGALAARRELRGRVRVRDREPLDALSSLARLGGLRRAPRLSVSATLAGPVSLPNGEICLPGWTLEALTGRQLRAMLAHEVAHCRRRDPLWQLAASLLGALFFVQPLNRLAQRRVTAAAELACDEWAARRTRDRRALVECLAECAEHLQASRLAPFASAMALPASGLGHRIARLLDGAPLSHGETAMKTRIIILVALAVIAFVLPGFLAAPSFAADNPPASASAARAAATSIRDEAIREAARAREKARAAEERARKAALAARKAEVKASRKEAAAAREAARQQATVARKQAMAARKQAEKQAALATRIAARNARRLANAARQQAAVNARREHGAASSCSVVLTQSRSVLTATGSASASLPACLSASDHGGSVAVARGDHTTRASIRKHDLRIKLDADGNFAFNKAEDDVASLGDGARLEITATRHGATHRAVFVGTNGGIERRYSVNGKARPFDAEARRWMAAIVPILLRESAINAKARIARLLKQGGPQAVLSEIGKIHSGYARSVYIQRFAQRRNLEATVLARLIASAADIDSGYSKERALAAIYQAQRPRGAQLTALLRAGPGINSDYETSRLLRLVAATLPLDNASLRPWLDMAAKLDSDYAMRMALSALLGRSDLSPAAATRVIKLAARRMHSPYALQATLAEAAKRVGASGKAINADCRAAARIGSDYDKREALSALLHDAKLKQAGYLCILDAVNAIGSDYDRAELLTELAATMPTDPALVAKYRADTDAISGKYERERAAEALRAR